MTYKVLVDDNFHYMDESERYELGEFPTLEAAIEAARKIVDEYLVSALQSGVAAQALMANYLCFGEDPYIVPLVPAESGILFSARDYARGRCDQLCHSVHNRANDG
jgi:hypothetical protein